jgi:hypothetical protein
LLLQLGAILLPAPAVAVKRRAFATSIDGTGHLSLWPGAGGFTGLAAGDNICRVRALAGGLPNPASYRAWLSTAGTDAYCHVQGLTGKKSTGCGGAPQPGAGPWYLANGITPFTPALAELTGAPRKIYRAVVLDEFGDSTPDLVANRFWTGTSPTGQATESNCLAWTTGSPVELGTAGSALGTRTFWSSNVEMLCIGSGRLLCFEPGASEASPPRWGIPGAIVFVTSAQGNGDLGSWPRSGNQQGIAAGDAICRNLAALAHLPAPQAFVAWLSTSFSDARDRLLVDGPFRRIDGLTVANSRADLLDGSIRESIHQDETGRYAGSCDWAWTGTNSNGTRAPDNCDDWLSPLGVNGQVGAIGFERVPNWTNDTQAPSDSCGLSQCLYCFANVVTLFWDGFDYTGNTGRWSSVTP